MPKTKKSKRKSKNSEESNNSSSSESSEAASSSSTNKSKNVEKSSTGYKNNPKNDKKLNRNKNNSLDHHQSHRHEQNRQISTDEKYNKIRSGKSRYSSKWDSPSRDTNDEKGRSSDKRQKNNDYNEEKYHRKVSDSNRRNETRERQHYRDRQSPEHRDNYKERRRSRENERRRSRSPRRRNFSNRNEDNNRSYEWGKRETNNKDSNPNQVEKEKPNFGLSGKLAEDTNKVNGVVIKYSEPEEARKPKRRWRLYPFKGEKALQTLYIHRQSCYLIGRDRKVCDLPVDHPSCSKQHAALQYRLVPYEREDGTTGKRVRPYLIDLESSNGTFINNKPIEPKKYFELLEKDVIKFGFSSREYVLLHENSKEDELDDDIIEDVKVKIEKEG